MDEELIILETEDAFELEAEEVVESEVHAEDLEQTIQTEESAETVEVEVAQEIEVGVDEAVGWVGGDSTRHYSLYGRDEPNQHPISAITGLREELNDIKALGVVYSNERNQANYYLWEDENILQENRVGYFVSACSDINKIKLCTSGNDIFGVTVDSAGFIGGQDDIARDVKYGLVVTTGVVHVRCELSVNIGDYVVSNDYGYAQSNKNGYKVVGRHQIDGVDYAEIILAAPINRICKLSDDVENVNERMNEAENNISAAMKAANDAYNKAGAASNVSEEAVKNALEALNKSKETSGIIKDLENSISENNKIATEARARADSASNAAITAKDEAIATANDAWAKSKNVEKGFESLTTKIDQYSVGEYSQAYGLTLEQAALILNVGMIYIPTKHLDSESHYETYLYTDENGEQQQTRPYGFTPGNHYEWDGAIWQECGNTVAFFSEEPDPTGVVQYWYIDSNEAPKGYEAHALYTWNGEKWQKENILEGNASNRMTSMVKQTTNRISAEITNARGSYTGLDARLTNVDSQLQLATFWNNPDSGKSNLAAVKSSSSDDGSNLALVVMSQDSETQLGGASIVLGTDSDKSYIQFDANHINFNVDNFKINANHINFDADDFQIKANKIDFTSGDFTIDADHVNFDAENFEIKANKIKFTTEDYDEIAGHITISGGVTFEDLKTEGYSEINGSNIKTGVITSTNYEKDKSGSKLNLATGSFDSPYFKIDGDNNVTTIGPWTVTEKAIYIGRSSMSGTNLGVYIGADEDGGIAIGTGKELLFKASNNLGFVQCNYIKVPGSTGDIEINSTSLAGIISKVLTLEEKVATLEGYHNGGGGTPGGSTSGGSTTTTFCSTHGDDYKTYCENCEEYYCRSCYPEGCPNSSTHEDPEDPCAYGHNWGNWETTTEADCVTNAIQTRSCILCSATETQEVSGTATGHSTTYGICSNCGECIGHDLSAYCEVHKTSYCPYCQSEEHTNCIEGCALHPGQGTSGYCDSHGITYCTGCYTTCPLCNPEQ